MSQSSVTPQRFPHSENGARITRARTLLAGANGHPIGKEKFAELVGTTRRHMIRLENGEHRPSPELRDRIVEVTGTTEQIASDNDEDEDALLRALMNHVRLEQSGMSLEGWMLMYDNLSLQHAKEMRRRALRDIHRSFELERAIS